MCVNAKELEETREGDICTVCNTPFITNKESNGTYNKVKLKCQCDNRLFRGANKGWGSST